jgi:type IV pilus assembly protein PilW
MNTKSIALSAKKSPYGVNNTQRCGGDRGIVDWQTGFTLIELLLALALGSLLLVGVYEVLINHQRTFALREQIAEMQQNARMGMDMMVRELRIAGYNPTGSPGVGILVASAHSIHFTMDLNGDGDIDDDNEDVTYSLYDSGGDGDQDLGRDTGGGRQPVVENLESLDFVYTLADGTSTSTPGADDLSEIRTIHVTLTARTASRDPNYSENNGYRTMTLRMRVQIKNMGL